MKLSVFLFVTVALTYACSTPQPVESYEYVYKIEQDSRFDKMDIQKMMSYQTNVVSEKTLEERISWNKMILVDSTFILNKQTQVYIYHSNSASKGATCYVTKDKVKLIAYLCEEADASLYFVIKSPKFRKTVYELLKNKKFKLWQLEEELPTKGDVW